MTASSSSVDTLMRLDQTIRQRLRDQPESSYTAQLAAKGIARIAQKVGEEGVELALAAATGSRDEVVSEAADLLFHMLVLLNAREVELAAVTDELRAREA